MRVFIALLIVIAAACSSGAASRTSVPTTAGASSAVTTTHAPADLPAPEELCALLSADDWAQFGYVTADSPTVDTDGAGSAYCVYAGQSGGTGGLELDAFVDVALQDAVETQETILDEGPDMEPIDLPGADAAFIGDEGDVAGIVVRTGRFTFTIALPSGDDAEEQLKTLANEVIDQSAVYR
jgi:hypothetical protein